MIAGDDAACPIVIAIGSNLAGRFGPPLASCRRAVAILAALPMLRAIGVSAWYDTEPMPKSMQPCYTNGVATFAPRNSPVDPAELLHALQRIEAEFGRIRATPVDIHSPAEREARTLDLDIIAIGDLIRDAPDPVLPHPRAHLRRFVLEPLRDILPGWRHPRTGLEIGAMVAGLPDEGIRRLAGGEG